MSYTVQENRLAANGWGGLGEASADISMSSDFTTSALDVLYFDMGALQINWSGADATDGVVIIQGSIDGVNWCDIPTGRTIDMAAGSQLFNVTSYGFRWVRLKFSANTNTTGTFNALSVLKVRN